MEPRQTAPVDTYYQRGLNITNPNFLFRHHKGRYINGQYVQNITDVYIGDKYALNVLFGGIEFDLDGRRGIVCGAGPRNTRIVRWYDSGMPDYLNPDTEVEVLRNTKGWGLPLKGEFVRVLTGPEQDRIGIVYKPGTNSTYVHFLEGTTPDKFKVQARAVQIVDVAVQVLTPAP